MLLTADRGVTVLGVPVQKPRRLPWLKNAAHADNIAELQPVLLTVNRGVTAVGVLAVKMRNLLKSSMITARIPALALIVKPVR